MYLVAKFAIEASRLARIIKAPPAADNEVSVEAMPNEPGVAIVGGQAQAVMFAIGAVAAQGEDGLLMVARLPA